MPLSSFHLLLKMRCDIQFIPQLFIRLFNRKKLISLPHIVSDGIFKQTYGRVWFVQAYGHKYQKVQMLIQQIELKNVSKYFLIVTCVSMCFFYIYDGIFQFQSFCFHQCWVLNFDLFLALAHTYQQREKNHNFMTMDVIW